MSKRITFPRMIPGNKVGDMEFVAQGSINAGFFTPVELGLAIPVDDTDIDRANDAFFGGKCKKIGRNKETGFYVCTWNSGVTPQPDIVMAIWVPHLDKVTKLGMSLLETHFGDDIVEVELGVVNLKPAVDGMSAEEAKEMKKIRKEAEKSGRKGGVNIPQFVAEPTIYANPESVISGRFED